MAKWKWADFWGKLTGSGDPPKHKKQQDRPARRRWFPEWGTPGSKVVAVLVMVVIFGTLATLLLVAVVRFFSRFMSKFDELGGP